MQSLRRGAVARQLLALAAVVVSLIPRMAPAQAQAQPQANALEYAVKTTFLYKFAAFVEWPAGAFPSASAPFVLCVVGDDPVSRLIDEAVIGQHVGGRAMTVRHIGPGAAEAGCHILYVGLSQPRAIAEALKRVAGMPVLSVTDTAQDGDAAAIVSFVIDNDRVRFMIDADAAANSHLLISSKLLSLAVTPKRAQ